MTRNLRSALAFLAAFLVPAIAMAADNAAAGVDTQAGLKAIGAGLAVGVAGLGTGWAQSKIGSAGVGAIAEDQKNFGSVLLLVAIPESILIFGFVIAFFLI